MSNGLGTHVFVLSDTISPVPLQSGHGFIPYIMPGTSPSPPQLPHSFVSEYFMRVDCAGTFTLIAAGFLIKKSWSFVVARAFLQFICRNPATLVIVSPPVTGIVLSGWLPSITTVHVCVFLVMCLGDFANSSINFALAICFE